MDEVRLHGHRVMDRGELETLLTTLNGAKNAICLDGCGDWMIEGSRGEVRVCEGKYFVYMPAGSAQAWTWAKKRLSGFATVSQDGDEEGILTFERMPTPEEAETLRSYIGLRQTREVSPEQIQRFREVRRKGSVGSPVRQSGSEASDPAGGAQALNLEAAAVTNPDGPHAA